MPGADGPHIFDGAGQGSHGADYRLVVGQVDGMGVVAGWAGVAVEGGLQAREQFFGQGVQVGGGFGGEGHVERDDVRLPQHFPQPRELHGGSLEVRGHPHGPLPGTVGDKELIPAVLQEVPGRQLRHLPRPYQELSLIHI